MEEKIHQKDMSIDVTGFYSICQLRKQNADITEVVKVVKTCYAPDYKRVTFTYHGCNYLIQDECVYVQTFIDFSL